MDRVKVFLRVKGDKRDGEFSFSEYSVVDTTGVYDFDKVFYGVEQEAVFQSISPMIDMCANGYNMMVFTYGQTGSGKTYTMEGTAENPGIIPHSIHQVFSKGIYTLSLSIVEVYNEKIFDLVSESHVTIREGIDGIILEGMEKVSCDSAQSALQVFERAIQNRRTEANGVNSRSSRSHMVFVIDIMKEIAGVITNSKITLVDLAGSEKIGSTLEAIPKSRSVHLMSKKQKLSSKSQETGNINKSLFCLSRIISTLSLESKAKHISYRDSKLTFILRDSLNLDTNLAIIGTVEPEDQAETKSTISFLSAAKKIKLTPKSTADEKTTEKLVFQIRHLSSENVKLKAQVQAMVDAQNKTLENCMLELVCKSIAEVQNMIVKTENTEKRVANLESMIETVKEKNNTIGNLLFGELLHSKKQEIDSIDSNL